MKFRLLAAAALSALMIGSAAFAQTAAPAGSTAAPAATPAPVAPVARPAAPPAPHAAAAAPTGQFKTEAEAKAHCPSDVVVWVNKETKVYHMAGTRYFGKTKSGAFMCQKEADAAKFHASRARNETATPARPAAATTTPAATAPAARTAPAATTPAPAAR